MRLEQRYAPRIAGVLAAALLLAAGVPPAQADPKRLYLNSYGSSWGLWARGSCLLEAHEGGLTLVLEELTLEPNHNYPQALEIAGFRLASVLLDAATGDRKAAAPAIGPRRDHAAALIPGQKTLVRGLQLELPSGQAAASGQVRLLLLQVLTPSGAAFEIEVTPIDGG